MMAAATLQPAIPQRKAIDRFAWHPDCWCFRGVTTALAFTVSGMYGLLLADRLGVLGGAILMGAGLAWPTLLAVVWFRSPTGWRFARLDWCLWTMTVGSVAMTLGLLATAVGQLVDLNPLITLLGGLVLADVAMGWVFTRYAPTLDVKRTTALLIWVVGMNGFLAGVVGLAAWLERIA